MHIDHVHEIARLLRFAIIPKLKRVYESFSYTIRIRIEALGIIRVTLCYRDQCRMKDSFILGSQQLAANQSKAHRHDGSVQAGMILIE